ncbi:peroxidase family protein [Rhizobium herbae]
MQTNGAQGAPLFGASTSGNPASIPAYNIAWGLRTVDGSYNHLLPGQEQWGAADQEFLELLDPQYRTIMVDPDGTGPSPAIPITYTPGNDVDGAGTFADPGDVIDPEVRTISNLIVDQTLGNPSAILTALQRAGVDDPGMVITATISAAYAPLQDEFRAVADAQRVQAAAAAAAAANPGNAGLQTAAADAAAALATAQTTLDTAAGGPGGLYELLATNGIELDGANVHLPNVAPDEGLSAPFNSWFTLFGQFFDHGLDLVNKGGNGAVMIPLQPDDPLYVPGSTTNFMVLTRATTSPGADGVLGDNPATVGIDESLDDGRPVNTTTSYVDQNQTYTSNSSHQVFIRQYVSTPGGPAATGKLIEGGNGGMATWAELKAQAATVLGIQLTDQDVAAVPLLRTDAYGNFIPGANGYPQLIIGIGPDGVPNTGDDLVVEGNPADPVDPHNVFGTTAPAVPVRSIFTNHAFLADIAHGAAPDGLADGDTEIGGNIPVDGVYDNELLDAHFIAGDGRVNENIGLTAVHHVFHAEHNRLADHTKAVVLADATAMLAGGATQAEAVAFLNEWLAVDVTTVPADLTGLVWDGERLFQAAKFGTEMQYQHLVFEEFARKIQPNINVFLVPDGFDTTLNPSIVAEFAHVVYRFGHSMLTESIDKFDPTFTADHISLIQGFLNPTAFDGVNHAVTDDIAAGAIIRGMTRQVGNQIDEFVTSALRNNLLGLPLDLATINLARGRDTGVPSLNAARAEFYEASNQNILLKPYESWVDFAGHLKNEASIINFIASYGTHALITGQTTIEGKRDAAMTLITGTAFGDIVIGDPLAFEADRLDFLNATGIYAGGSLGGLNNVDLWIGGLAEETMPFGGMLGSTFNFVFEVQMENLQSGDRFYYLQRLDGLHLFGEMENNSFAAMIMRNTDATHLPSDVFSTPGLILEVDQTKQFNDLNGDGILENTDPTGGGILTPLVVRNNPGTVGPDINYLRYTGDDHVVLGGTGAADIIIGSIGDDTLFGDGGNDKLEGGFGNDIINAGDGDDIITDAGGDDNIKAGTGNDVVHAGPGLDLVMGNDGHDFIFLGTDMGSEVFAGTGNDFIYGNKNAERILGNEGNDWIETGTFDGAPGDNFDEVFSHDGINGHDVFLGDGGFDEYIGEGGDDIMVGSAGRGKMAGMSGFDWATYKDSAIGSAGVNADLSIPIIFDEAPTIPGNAALDEYQSMEGLSGSAGNDILRGSNILADERLPFNPITNPSPLEGYQGSALNAEGIALIAGLQAVLGAGVTSFSAGDIILGGDGSDILAGQMGDDIIDGDKWLNVKIGVYANVGPDGGTGALLSTHKSMTELASQMFSGAINPGQLRIIREIVSTADATPDTDVAVFADVQAAYTITRNADGTITVAHTDITDGLESDGVDRLRNIEVLRFSDGDFSLTPPTLQLHAFDATTYLEQFTSDSYTADDGAWTQNWVEADNNSSTTGDIEIEGGQLTFDENITGGELISRAVDLTGVNSATLTFNYDDNSVDAGESLVVEAFDGTNWVSLGSLGESTVDGDGVFSANLTPQQIGAHSAIRFRAEGNWDGGESIEIDNVSISFTKPAVAPTINHETTFTEGGAAVSVANRPGITDADDIALTSARIVLTNAQVGDQLVAGTLPAGISANTVIAAGQITINLVGSASLAAYQNAIQAVVFSNTSTTPAIVDRIVQVTVSDGLFDSNVATTIVNVTPVDSPVNANNDTIITNAAPGTAFNIPEWVLLANDVDADDIPDVTAVSGANGLTAALNVGFVAVTDTGTPDGSFSYTATGGPATDTATVNIDSVVATTTYSETFGGTSYTDSDGAWTQDWVETGDDANSTSDDGQIRINNSRLEFDNGNTAGNSNGAVIQRSLAGLAGATSATISYNYTENLDAGETVTVAISRDGVNFQTIQTLTNTTTGTSIAGLALTGPFTNAAFIRFTASAMNDADDLVSIDNISIAFTSPANTVNGGTGSDILVGDVNGSTFDAGLGNDTVLAENGNDTIVWNANTATGGSNANGDGRDFVDGGAGTDTFDVNGNNNSETYRLYTRAEAIIAGLTGLNANTEIVITRGATTNNAAIIAELDNIEEITVDTFGGTDAIQVFGDFTGTSLALNTITIDGGTGDDTVDISALRSAHRLVFRSNGGNDTIIGTLRAQDVIELPNGATAADYHTTTTNGVTTMTRNGHTITFCRETDDDDNGTPPPVAARSLIGTAAANKLVGAAGDDVILGGGGGDILVGDAGKDILRGEDGDDVITAGDGKDSVSGGKGSDELHGGAGVDMLFGDAGDDLIHGDGGDDLIEAGAGADQVWGGEGDDTVIAKPNDGSDRYWGGDGADTLDYSAVLGNLTVDLGNGFMQRGSVTGSTIGSDTIYGFENFVGGAGHDRVTATTAVNIMDGGAGNDTFRFTSTGAINDDVIYGFQPGDKIDFSPIDANVNVAGKQGFVLATTLNAAGKVVVFHEVQDGNEVTVIHGNVDGTGVDFELTLDGKHNLTASDFQGVS